MNLTLEKRDRTVIDTRPAGRRETNTVLFLCTGNYYRSRFAEELFNHLAAEAGLEWQAVSRGIALERGLHNVGPMSAQALEGLAQRGVTARAADRFPAQARDEELARADKVIALKEDEHRPLLQARYPRWADRVEYWHVDDLYDSPFEQALAEIESNVRHLVEQLGGAGQDQGDRDRRHRPRPRGDRGRPRRGRPGAGPAELEPARDPGAAAELHARPRRHPGHHPAAATVR